MTDMSARYRLAFDLLTQTKAHGRDVIPSVKFTPGHIDRNRYYVDLSEVAPQDVDADIALIKDALALPPSAAANSHTGCISDSTAPNRSRIRRQWRSTGSRAARTTSIAPTTSWGR